MTAVGELGDWDGVEGLSKKENIHGHGQPCGDCRGEGSRGGGRGYREINGGGRRLDLGR